MNKRSVMIILIAGTAEVMRSLEQDYISGVFTPFAEATTEEVDETQKPPTKRVASSTDASGKKTPKGKRPQKKTKIQPG